MRCAAADCAGIGEYRTETQAEPLEYPAVSLVHDLVLALQVGVVEMEGVGVLHQELAPAHHAEARADLGAELRPDRVEPRRPPLVAGPPRSREARDDLL